MVFHIVATMTGTTLTVILIAAAVLIALCWLAAKYNKLITLRQRVLNGFAQIDVQLKRRHDLIPNLVEVVKGYMAHEKQTLERVIAARNAAAGSLAGAAPMTAATIQTLGMQESALTGSLGQLFAMKEAYPQLKADRSAGELMEQLSSTENRVGFARQAYNDSVMFYNTERMQFPTSLVAGVFGFQPAELFQIEDANQREVVNVNLNS